VISGMMRISPRVQTASRIQPHHARQPRCLVLMSVTACVITCSLPHFGQTILHIPLCPPVRRGAIFIIRIFLNQAMLYGRLKLSIVLYNKQSLLYVGSICCTLAGFVYARLPVVKSILYLRKYINWHKCQTLIYLRKYNCQIMRK